MSVAAVAFLPRAKREIDEADEWWRANRAHPDAILDAIDRFIVLVLAQPRLLLADVEYHLYYRVVGRRVEVLSLWHVRRGSGPGL